MSNIIHAPLDNFSGLLRTLYLVTPEEAPRLVIVNDFVTQFHSADGSISDVFIYLSFFERIDFTMDTLSYKEEQVIQGGDIAYKKTIAGIVPKDRVDVFRILKAWSKKRAMIVATARDGTSFVVGGKTTPAVIQFTKSNGPTAEERNQYEISITQTSKDPAPYCNVG